MSCCIKHMCAVVMLASLFIASYPGETTPVSSTETRYLTLSGVRSWFGRQTTTAKCLYGAAAASVLGVGVGAWRLLRTPLPAVSPATSSVANLGVGRASSSDGMPQAALSSGVGGAITKDVQGRAHGPAAGILPQCEAMAAGPARACEYTKVVAERVRVFPPAVRPAMSVVSAITLPPPAVAVSAPYGNYEQLMLAISELNVEVVYRLLQSYHYSEYELGWARACIVQEMKTRYDCEAERLLCQHISHAIDVRLTSLIRQQLKIALRSGRTSDWHATLQDYGYSLQRHGFGAHSLFFTLLSREYPGDRSVFEVAVEEGCEEAVQHMVLGLEKVLMMNSWMVKTDVLPSLTLLWERMETAPQPSLIRLRRIEKMIMDIAQRLAPEAVQVLSRFYITDVTHEHQHSEDFVRCGWVDAAADRDQETRLSCELR